MFFSAKLHLAIQMFQALVYMHNHTPAVAHLDLKPENILVCAFTNELCVGHILIHSLV